MRPPISRLREFCRDKLQTRPKGLTLKQIAEETGISFRWLRLLSTDKYQECSCVKLEQLYVYFTGRELEL